MCLLFLEEFVCIECTEVVVCFSCVVLNVLV